MKKLVGLLITLIAIVAFSGHTQHAKTEKFDVTIVVDYSNYTLPNKKDLLMQNRIKNIVEQELTKLPDVNVRNIKPGVPGQIAPKFIINVLASTYDDRFISFVTLFLQRSSIPEFFIAPKSIDAYKAWDNLSPDYVLIRTSIPKGYCSKDRLEEYIKGDINNFDNKVLRAERVFRQFGADTIDILQRIE